MSHERIIYRIKVQAQMCLHPDWLRIDVLPLAPTPGFVRLGPHVPTEIPLDLVPPDLRPIGTQFWMLFDGSREAIGVEPLGSAK